MESFLASRPAITKLGSTMKTLSGEGAFTPYMDKKAGSANAPAPLAAPSGAPAVAAEPANAPHQHAVQVEMIRENGAVRGIVVTCKCGERIELDCVY